MPTPMSHLLTSFVMLVATVFAGTTAFAADPATADWLAASCASLNLGNEHKLRSERTRLPFCAATTCPADVSEECLSPVNEVKAQVPTVVFSAKDGAGADLKAVKVTMDHAEVLADWVEGTVLSIDPGEDTFVLETPGQSPVTRKAVIGGGQKDRRGLVAFGVTSGQKASVLASSPAQAPAPLPPAQPTLPTTESGGGMGAQEVLALVAGGVGLVGLGIGTVFGVMAISQKSDAQSVCPNNPCATQEGVNKWNTAGSTGNISTIGFIVGAVGAVGGAVLWFTAPSSSGSAHVGVGPRSLQVIATW